MLTLPKLVIMYKSTASFKPNPVAFKQKVQDQIKEQVVENEKKKLRRSKLLPTGPKRKTKYCPDDYILGRSNEVNQEKELFSSEDDDDNKENKESKEIKSDETKPKYRSEFLRKSIEKSRNDAVDETLVGATPPTSPIIRSKLSLSSSSSSSVESKYPPLVQGDISTLSALRRNESLKGLTTEDKIHRQREQMKEWRENHPGYHSNYHREYYTKNRETILAKLREKRRLQKEAYLREEETLKKLAAYESKFGSLDISEDKSSSK